MFSPICTAAIRRRVPAGEGIARPDRISRSNRLIIIRPFNQPLRRGIRSASADHIPISVRNQIIIVEDQPVFALHLDIEIIMLVDLSDGSSNSKCTRFSFADIRPPLKLINGRIIGDLIASVSRILSDRIGA